MKTFNILIIEDEFLIALNLKQILERNNYKVIGIAKDSSSALFHVQNNKIDLILADIYIAGHLNGIETVKLIQNSFDIPVIFLTAHQEEKFLKQASQVNFLGYIVKPYFEETFLREVKLAYYTILNSHNNISLKLTQTLSYNIQEQSLKENEEEMILSRNEKQLLHLLVVNKNRIVLNEQIDSLLWHDNPVDDTTRRQLLFRLRKKLPQLNIQTIKGVGYKFISEELL
ncbi:response regulator [Candidatus Marinarcus aquaticus]|uniref:DNA-binding response regulator n=1 Tax=Candidatus Marinarcus aquaticus TaxID=2044504 RepID=A0A4Q0XM10_9BACT|nr:response regulator [Candidatus Marinarcus aquaticus]RXJ54101.1 hypothetical protein CRV04_12015 [Candidatus Marinarcus aquaticus]